MKVERINNKKYGIFNNGSYTCGFLSAVTLKLILLFITLMQLTFTYEKVSM